MVTGLRVKFALQGVYKRPPKMLAFRNRLRVYVRTYTSTITPNDRVRDQC